MSVRNVLKLIWPGVEYPRAEVPGVVQHFPKCRFDLSGAHGLGEKLANPERLRGAREITGRKHDLYARLQSLRLLRELDAIRSGHHDVGKEHIDMLLREDARGLDRALGSQDAKPLRRDDVHDAPADQRIVINDQYREYLCHYYDNNRTPCEFRRAGGRSDLCAQPVSCPGAFRLPVSSASA